MKLKPVHFLGAAVCGLLTAAAFPKFDLMSLAWISFIPLFFLLVDKKPGQAFLVSGQAGPEAVLCNARFGDLCLTISAISLILALLKRRP